jgi:hypothetical protein
MSSIHILYLLVGGFEVATLYISVLKKGQEIAEIFLKNCYKKLLKKGLYISGFQSFSRRCSCANVPAKRFAN